MGWEKNLWSLFQKKITHGETPIEKTCECSEALLSGYVSFLAYKTGKSLEEEILYIEGEKWVGAVITKDKVILTENLKETEWVICYFKENSLNIPKEHWDYIRDPIRVFGDVIPISFEVDFGKANCYVKARAAAYILKK